MGYLQIYWKRNEGDYKALLRNTNKIAFRTLNTIQNTITPHLHIDKYERSGIYLMKYMNCPLK
jgi:hypothetical protein